MVRITQLKLPCGHTQDALEEKIRRTLRTGKGGSGPLRYRIVRHSVDARKKPDLFDIYTVDVESGRGSRADQALVHRLKNKNVALAPVSTYSFPDPGTETLGHRPVVIGTGPAGLFCALYLAEHGYRPLVLERGYMMEARAAAVEKFWREGALDPVSNVQFGEGGAGTFSDGKLNTQINDKTGRADQVLQVFVQAGAPESILYEAKPHIGTDRLRTVIPAIRRRIEAAGGEIRFGTRVTGFTFSEEDPEPSSPADDFGKHMEDMRENEPDTPAGHAASAATGRRCLTGLRCVAGGALPGSSDREEWIPADVVVLAVGHSARDTIEELYREQIPLEQKQFAVGLRVAHPQSTIDESQYGFADRDKLASMRLGASPYKVTARASSGRGVYSFCMCPGGHIVNASSEPGHLCVNGMSDEKRDSGWANSAIVVTVGAAEFGSDHVLAGMEFQRRLERKAWEMGRGAVPVQKYSDFRDCFRGEKKFPEMQMTQNVPSGPYMPAAEYLPDRLRGACRQAPVHTLLPASLTGDIIEGMEQFGHKIRGFNGPLALVAGVESRTSSPVRIPRDAQCESIGAAGLYPCGEGAGYAGGIMSAAMDGMRIAEAIARKYSAFTKDPEMKADTGPEG